VVGLAGCQPPPAAYTFRVVAAYPHDPEAFTQGLVYSGGALYESTGLYGLSSVREVALETGDVQRSQPLDGIYFGEGLALVDDTLIQLTWKEQTLFAYDRATLAPTRQVPVSLAEGWGLAYDGKQLIVSDGSASLYFWDPDTFAEVRRIEVHDENGPIDQLNELEFVEGRIYANIWHSDRIAIIHPRTGWVTGWVDLAGLLPPAQRVHREAVLNGIAYDPATGRLFVTGKWWPAMFEIEITAVPGSQ